jgi:hypothetical protein
MKRSAPSKASLGSAHGRRLGVCAGVLTLALGVGGGLAPGAGAKTATLHFFQKSVTNDFFNAAGKSIQLNPPQTVPVKGDRLDTTDLDYVGNAAHHAKQWTASDHLSCTFTATAAATCDVELAVGGSLLLGTDLHIQFGPGATVVKLNGGTGIFKGVHGTATSANVGNSNNANLTVKLS